MKKSEKPMLKWEDVTCYSRDKPRVVASTEATTGRLRLVVTRRIHQPKEQWFGFCDGFGVDELLLGSGTIEEAQLVLEGLVRELLADASRSLGAGAKSRGE